MTKDPNNILDLVIKATKDRQEGADPIRVSTTDELIDIIYSQKSGVVDSGELSTEEQFYWDIYSEILDDINYFFEQSKYLLHLDYQPTKINKIDKKLQELLTVIDKSPPLAKEYIQSYLHMDDEDTISACVFCLSSINRQQPDSAYLDYAIVQFAKAEPKYHISFINGLKHGLHQQISKRLLLLLEVSQIPVKISCLDILAYRDDFPAEQLRSFTDDEDEEIRIRKLIIFANQKHQINATILLLLEHINQPKALLFEEALLACLLNHSPLGLDFCRRICSQLNNKQNDSTRTAKEISSAIKLLSLAGNQQDIEIVKSACRHQDIEIQKAGFATLGEYGLAESIEELIEYLDKESNEEIKTLAAGALEKITGACLMEDENVGDEDHDDESEKVPCISSKTWKDWWRQNANIFTNRESGKTLRWRKGKQLSIKVLIDEMQAEENNYIDRKLAWQELVMRSGTRYSFEPDWTIDKQMKSFDNWVKWLQNQKTTLSDKIWAFGGW